MNNADMPLELIERLSIDGFDGSLLWYMDTGSAKKGENAGSEVGRGYIQVKFKGKRYLAHRILFFMFNGYLPEQVDHIDGDTSNNSKDNLRSATHSENMINRKHQCNNKSGYRGIDWMPRQRQWRAQIHKDGKKIYLGIRKNLEDAIILRSEAEAKYHGEYSRK
jgi:hypothetical protein